MEIQLTNEGLKQSQCSLIDRRKHAEFFSFLINYHNMSYRSTNCCLSRMGRDYRSVCLWTVGLVIQYLMECLKYDYSVQLNPFHHALYVPITVSCQSDSSVICSVLIYYSSWSVSIRLKASSASGKRTWGRVGQSCNAPFSPRLLYLQWHFISAISYLIYRTFNL